MNVKLGRITQCLAELSEEHRELYGTTVEAIQAPIEPLHFFRDFAAQNKPCLVKGTIDDWPARQIWCASYLREKLGDCQVPIVATPDGRADAVSKLPGTKDEVFALPAEGFLTLAAFLEELALEPDCRSGRNVLYMQQQNDCLRKDFAALFEDVKPMLPWASQAFGGEPEAVNLWIGGKESVTTFHKDPYENLFAVISGSKTFYLLPPCDYYRLGAKDMPIAKYERLHTCADFAADDLELRKQNGDITIRWSSAEPRPTMNEGGQGSSGSTPAAPEPIVLTVRPGEVLYLPSLWHHFVEQCPGPDGVCIAVNFWYNMAFDAKFAYYNFAEKLGDLCSQ